MGDSIQIRADESLVLVLEKIRKEVAEMVKEYYNIDSVEMYGSIASKVLAARFNNENSLKFKIRKTTKNEGVIEIY